MVERCVMEAQLFMNKIKLRGMHICKLWPDSFRCGLRHEGFSKNLSAAGMSEKEIVFPNLATRVVYRSAVVNGVNSRHYDFTQNVRMNIW